MQNLNSKTRIEILSTIDELNQYLNGNVTTEALLDALEELQLTLPLLTNYVAHCQLALIQSKNSGIL